MSTPNVTSVKRPSVARIQPAGLRENVASKAIPAGISSSYSAATRRPDLGASAAAFTAGLSRFGTPLTTAQRNVVDALCAGATDQIDRGPGVVRLTDTIKALA